MARVAHEVMVEAERAFRRADALSAEMEPHLLKRVNQSAIYGYTNDRADRNVPPGDVLLAAALAAGISLDQKLGLALKTPEVEMNDLRTEVAEMRDEMARLRAEVAGTARRSSEAPADGGIDAAREERAAQRRAWAARSQPAAPADQPIQPQRRGGRGSSRV